MISQEGTTEIREGEYADRQATRVIIPDSTDTIIGLGNQPVGK